MGVPARWRTTRRPVGFCCPGLRPGTRCEAKSKSTSTAAVGMLGLAGRCGLAGHAVTPLRGPAQPLAAVRSGACEAVLRKQSALTHGGSMAPCSCALSCAHGKTGVGRPAQPARGVPRAHGANGPASPHRPTSDRSRRLIAVGGCRPWSTHIHATRGCERSDPLLTLIFFFLIFRGGRTRKLSKAGRGGFAGVSAPWMARLSPQGRVHGVPREPTPPGQARLLIYAINQPRHEGLSRWPSPSPRARPAARPGSAPRCRAGTPVQPSPVRWPRHVRRPAPPVPAHPMPAATQ